MGYNLAGIVINKNLQAKPEELSAILDVTLVFDQEIDSTIANAEEQTADFIDVYFSPNGTLILAHQDLCLDNSYAHPETNIMTFAHSETAMAFYFEYTENQTTVRSKMEIDGVLIEEHGNKLGTEDATRDTSAVIWEQVAAVLGLRFEDIQPEEKWIRYGISAARPLPYAPAAILPEEKITHPDSIARLRTGALEVPETRPANKSHVFILLGLITGCLLLIAGLVYAIYSIVTLP